MISLEDMKKIDISEMYKVYDEWPTIAEDSYNSDLEQLMVMRIVVKCQIK